MVHSIPDLLSERAHVLGSTLFDFSSPDLASNARGERRAKRASVLAVRSTALFGPGPASAIWETVAAEVFPQDPVLPNCVSYLDDRRYFATANAPICLPMAVPTSVELR
jgi:hypothetical protein